MTGARRKARILALQALYEFDATGHDAELALERLLAGARLSEKNSDFTVELVKGVIHHQGELDRHIGQFAPAWPVAQIPSIDRNILRMAIFEILFHKEVPVKVAINEAVELAKGFGSDNSPRFVNGVLGSLSSVVGVESPNGG